MIKVGDIVKVTDWGRNYSTHKQWFLDNMSNLNIEWLIRYAFGDRSKYEECKYDDDTEYKVLYISDKDHRALISRGTYEVYLIGIDALMPYYVEVEMTIKEIEEKLGISNLKIVKETDE